MWEELNRPSGRQSARNRKSCTAAIESDGAAPPAALRRCRRTSCSAATSVRAAARTPLGATTKQPQQSSEPALLRQVSALFPSLSPSLRKSRLGVPVRILEVQKKDVSSSTPKFRFLGIESL